MDFKLLNDTICGESRLVIIVDDTNDTLEKTTRAVFPAARICMDTQNKRNRMIVLIDHATSEIKEIAKNFFQNPDSKTDVRVVSVPYTEALRAEKPAQPKKTTAKDSMEVQINQAGGEAKTDTSVPVQNGPNQKEAQPAQPKQPKRLSSRQIVWGESPIVQWAMQDLAKKYKMVVDSVAPEADYKAFYHMLQGWNNMPFDEKIRWIDAIGTFGIEKKSRGALIAAYTLLTNCAKNQSFFTNGKVVLQNMLFAACPIIREMMEKNHITNFEEYFDHLTEDGQKELVRQVYDKIRDKFARDPLAC